MDSNSVEAVVQGRGLDALASFDPQSCTPHAPTLLLIQLQADQSTIQSARVSLIEQIMGTDLASHWSRWQKMKCKYSAGTAVVRVVRATPSRIGVTLKMPS
jgi:hypothetical protein